jgi:hypothetical protein
MKIKLNEKHEAEWKYIQTPVINLYKGDLITYRLSIKYGYRFNIISLDGSFYLTMSLYNPITKTENITVQPVKSINDAKAVIEAMIQLIKNYHRRSPENPHEVDA